MDSMSSKATTKFVTSVTQPHLGSSRMVNSPLLRDGLADANVPRAKQRASKSVRFSKSTTVHYGRSNPSKACATHKVNVAPLRQGFGNADATGGRLFKSKSLDLKSADASVDDFKFKQGIVRSATINGLVDIPTDYETRYRRLIDRYMFPSQSMAHARSLPALLEAMGDCGDDYLAFDDIERLPRRTSGYVPHYAQRVLDAPGLPNDFYTNVVDWSASNLLAIGLENQIYTCLLTNGDLGGDIYQTDWEVDGNSSTHFTCLKFSPDGCTLALAMSSGTLELVDMETKTSIRYLCTKGPTKGVMAWQDTMLACGDSSGQLSVYDARQKQRVSCVKRLHTGQLCGLAWSLDGQFLATAGEDCLVKVHSSRSSMFEPMLLFDDHSAPVKAVCWHPTKKSLLATGGGHSADSRIRVWDIYQNTCKLSRLTPAPITGIQWSRNYSEIVTAHSEPAAGLHVWTYPSLTVLKLLSGHMGRILTLIMSPCGNYLLTAAADESLRIWPCFLQQSSAMYHARRRFVDDFDGTDS